jgi:serine/threonine-protein phosphatase 2A regulatory subunit A
VQNVRVAFSKTVVHLCPAFGKETSQKLLVPLIQQLSKDEHHQVRNNVISELEALSDALGPSGLVTGLLPSLIELSKDPKWRVRMAVVDKSSLLAKHLGVKNFEKKMQNIIIVSLSDHVFAIREKACTQIGFIVEEFGGKWAAEKFFPSCFQIYDKTTNYLHRMTCLLLISNVAPVCSGEVIEKHLLPLVASSCADDVANVRIHAARTLNEIIPRVDKTLIKSKIQPALLKLAKDTDEDVAYFAAKALEKCE